MNSSGSGSGGFGWSLFSGSYPLASLKRPEEEREANFVGFGDGREMGLERERRFIGGMGFGGFENHPSKGFKLIDAIGERDAVRELSEGFMRNGNGNG